MISSTSSSHLFLGRNFDVFFDLIFGLKLRLFLGRVAAWLRDGLRFKTL